MAYPTKYTRQYDFVTFQNGSPNTPLPADKVNADYNFVEQSIDEIVDFLKLFTRSDGQIANAIVGADQLSPAVLAALSSFSVGTVTTLAAGSSATVTNTGTSLNPVLAFGIPRGADGAGSGDVSKVGTPVDGQIGVWTGNGTIEGDAALTFDTTDDSLVIAASGNLKFGAVIILDDAAGTMTLSNIDALDATTEATIEAAIDTLANLTSIQGVAFTFGAYAATLLNNANEAAFKAAANLEAGVDFQAYDATLAALAAYNTNGLVVQTAADTFAGRTIAGTASQISVANGDGVLGNPTLSLPASITVATSYQVGGVKVVEARKTGWGAPTGTATRTAFDTTTVTTAQLAERVKALIDDLTSHGMVGA